MPLSNKRSTGDGVTLDTIFEALGNRSTRRILMAFAMASRWETERLIEFAASEPDRADGIRFHHQFLPHLEDAGFIERVEAADAYTRGEQFAVIRPYVELLHEEADHLPLEWP